MEKILSRLTEYPILRNELRADPDASDSITTISGDMDRGQEIIDKLNDKSIRFMEKWGREPKYAILDPQSYLDLHGYAQSMERYSHTHTTSGARFASDNLEVIYTSTGPLTPIVLPQRNRRIQVSGDSWFTAIQHLSENLNE